MLLAAVQKLPNASHQRIEVIAIAVIACLLIFELVRRKYLLERYALLWLASGGVILLFAIWQGLLTSLSRLVGIYYPPSTLFAMVGVFVFTLLVHFSVTISRLSNENKVLAQRLSLVQARLDELPGRESAE